MTVHFGKTAHQRIMAFVLAGLSVLLSGGATADTEQTLPTWLVGCWESEDGQSLEAWTQDSEDTLIGFSSIVTDNAVSFYELMSIRIENNEALVFTAYPSNQPGGSFQAIEIGDQSIVFQSTEHDFPQRIRYRRSDDDLLADIALADGSNQIDFQKTRCAP